MSRLSLKMKLTLLYTVLMTAVVCGILVLLFSLGNRQILSSVQNQLRESVYGASGEIDWEDGRLELIRIWMIWSMAFICLFTGKMVPGFTAASLPVSRIRRPLMTGACVQSAVMGRITVFLICIHPSRIMAMYIFVGSCRFLQLRKGSM